MPVGNRYACSTLTEAEVEVEVEGFHGNSHHNAAGKMHFNFTLAKIKY